VNAGDLTAAIGNACLRNNTPLTPDALADAADKALDMVEALKKAPASMKPALEESLSATMEMFDGNGENGLPNPLLGTPVCKNMNKAAARTRS
jgi:hypothetical protein